MLKSVSSITNAIGALNYVGAWNASANTPPLASGVGVKGDYYVVSTAGTTTLDGISTWYVGDWAVFNGSVWQRVEGGVDDPAPSVRSNSTTGVLQITGPGAATTRVMTVPNANFTAARTDAAQTFSGVQTFSGNIELTSASGNVINNGQGGTAGLTLVHIGATGSDFYLGMNSSTGGRLNSGSAAYTVEFRNDLGFSFGNGTQFAYITSSGIQTSGNFINKTVIWQSGTGSPEGVVTAPVGSLFTRTNGGAGTTLYVKESGTGNTGWVAK